MLTIWKILTQCWYYVGKFDNFDNVDIVDGDENDDNTDNADNATFEPIWKQYLVMVLKKITHCTDSLSNMDPRDASASKKKKRRKIR